LSQDQRKILSQIDEEFASLMQMLTDEAKDGPRLFSFKPVDPSFSIAQNGSLQNCKLPSGANTLVNRFPP
jgi:hypothetical protein